MQRVKLGGSLITAKRPYKSSGKAPSMVFRRKIVETVSRELACEKKPLMIVHGAGSFGHVKAHKYGLHKVKKVTRKHAKGVAEVSLDVRTLNNNVMGVLEENGLNCISIPPNVTITNRNGKINSINTSYYKKYLGLGLIPISFGDLVSDSERGISVCSGDDIMVELVKAFKPSRAVFVTDEDGVFDSDPRKNKKAKLIRCMTPAAFTELMQEQKAEQSSVDVTGGMIRKTEVCMKISKLGCECMIINGLKKGRVTKALRGEKVIGTYF